MNKPLTIHNDIPFTILQSALQAAFAEDLGGYGDITTMATIDPAMNSTAHFMARQDGILAGIEIADAAFKNLDPDIQFTAHFHDGAVIKPNDKLATIQGNTAAILSAERVALNFVCHLSGIASLTNQFVSAVAGTAARITCTRKTRPLLRAFEKYAVRAGGGVNHRFNLSDAVLIKDNHIAACGDIQKAVEKAKTQMGHMVKISVEVDEIAQIEPAIAGGADVILLDNMTPDQLTKAVQLIQGRTKTEASGGIHIGNVKTIAATGVDYISVGRITHSAPWLDMSLDFIKS